MRHELLFRISSIVFPVRSRSGPGLDIKKGRRAEGITMSARDDAIGKLTGYRCTQCGCCMFLNNDGAFWCSGCGFKSHTMYQDLATFSFAPVPDEHPHVLLFGVHILHEKLAKEGK